MMKTALSPASIVARTMRRMVRLLAGAERRPSALVKLAALDYSAVVKGIQPARAPGGSGCSGTASAGVRPSA